MANKLVIPQKTEAYLAFLKGLNLSFTPIAIVEEKTPQNSSLVGWQPLISLTCLSEAKTLWEIDIRYGWSSEIWQQNLFDFAWNEEKLLDKKKSSDSKLIIYLCEPETGLVEAEKLESVPNQYIIYPYWSAIEHLYLRLPSSHPFGDLKSKQNNLTGYATTRNITTAPPNLTNNSSLLTTKLRADSPKKEGGLRTQGLFKKDTPELPLISIITVVFNGEKYLEQTIQSAINQSYSNLEYIIVDGGSTDRTLEIIQKYNAQIDYWVSEPDKGIYDAMNKGTTLASGRYTLHINADDLLFTADSLAIAYTEANMPGLVLIFHPEERVFKKRLSKEVDLNEYINAIRYPFHHQGFIGLRNQNSLFNTNYKIIADNLLMARKIALEKVEPLDKIIALHRREGVSAENNDAINRELLVGIKSAKSIRVYWTIYKKIIYSKLRTIAKALNLVTLKRKYLQ